MTDLLADAAVAAFCLLVIVAMLAWIVFLPSVGLLWLLGWLT